MKCLNETLQMSTHSICFHEEITKNINLDTPTYLGLHKILPNSTVDIEVDWSQSLMSFFLVDIAILTYTCTWSSSRLNTKFDYQRIEFL